MNPPAACRFTSSLRIALACAFTGLGTARAESTVSVPTEPGSGVTIKLTSPVAAVPHFGFMPVRVSIENLTTVDGAWRFRFDAGHSHLFPGVASSSFHLEVPSARTREAWFFVPLAEPGISVDAAALGAAATPGGGPLAVALPSLPGVYPDPKLPGVTHDVSNFISPGAAGLTRTYIIAQTGPSSALPPIAPASLPPHAKSTLTPPDPVANVTRTTVIPVAVNSRSAPRTTAKFSPAQLAGVSARDALTKAGFSSRGIRTSSSVQIRPTSTPSVLEVAVTMRQTGPAAALPLPPVGSLPSGFTGVSVVPETADGSTVTREFVYIENVSTALMSGAAAPAAAPRRTRRTTAGLGPGMLAVEVIGPGVTRSASRATFPNTTINPGMAPMAAMPAFEREIRGKFAQLGAPNAPNVASVEPAQLPADWRVWSSFNSVLLGADDFAALDSARRAALRGWVAMGGLLFLSPEVKGEPATLRFGAGRIETLGEPMGSFDATDLFSHLQIGVTAPAIPDREQSSFVAGTPMADLVAFEAADTLWVSLLLVGFAVLIGPVNLYVFAPAKKRHRLFVTMPLISLAGAAAIGLAILVQDGLGGEGVRHALVVLVPGENQAVVMQEQAARSGFLVSREFPLDDSVLHAVLPNDPSELRMRGASRVFERAEGRANGDWFRNRTRHAHLLRTIVPTRARVEWVGNGPDGAPQVESTIATELRDFRMRDGAGRIWISDTLPTGRRVTLRATDEAAAAARVDVATAGNGTPNFSGIVSGVSALTEPWQWAAYGGATELAPIATLRSIRWRDDPVLYAGIAEHRGIASAAGEAVEGEDRRSPNPSRLSRP